MRRLNCRRNSFRSGSATDRGYGTSGTAAKVSAWNSSLMQGKGSTRKGKAESRNWPWRSEEHTSELQSHLNLVCRLLLEKKKKDRKQEHRHYAMTITCSTPTALRSLQ